MLNRTCLLLCSSLLFLSPLQAAETPLTVYRASLGANPAFRAAQASLRAEQEGVNVALGQLLPNLSLNGSKSRNDTESIKSYGTFPQEYDSYSYSLNLRQPLYRKYNWAAYKQAEEQADMAGAKAIISRDDLATRVLTAYLDALYADTVGELLAAQRAAAQGQIEQAQKAFKGGMGTRIDIDEAQAKLDIVIAQQIEAINQQDNTRQTLRALVARPLEPLAVLDPKRIAMTVPDGSPLDTWLVAAREQNAELASAKAQIRVAEQEVQKALSGHYPTLDFVASKNKSNNDDISTLSATGDSGTKQTTFGLQATFPLFSGGGASASIRQAKARLEQAQLLADDVMQNIDVKVRKEYSGLVLGVAKVKAQEKAEASVTQTALAYRKGMQAGVRSNLDILQVDQQLYQTRRDLASARYQLILSRVKLLALAGRLTEDEVMQISTWFVPASY